MLLMGIIWGGIKLTLKSFKGMLKISNYKNPVLTWGDLFLI